MRKKTLIALIAGVVVIALVVILTAPDKYPEDIIVIKESEQTCNPDSLSVVTQMKVVILPDGTVARYVSEDETSYTATVQDTITVPKEGAKVETWSAADGRGVVYMKGPGCISIHAEPDIESKTVSMFATPAGNSPHVFKCRGFRDGWYEISGGFVQAQYMNWDAIDTF